MQKLSTLQPGQTAIITTMQQNGPVKRRLLEMGLVRGSKIKIIRRAPLGDPIEIEIRDYKLTLRKKEADTITVEAQP
ncbi:MAG: ferrous iron transport protein A [Crenarchaeota archaeon]|jgi:ferrous iron transport protein A|nr:ferrous iron transport protein A [Thermoproteota archaeon]